MKFRFNMNGMELNNETKIFPKRDGGIGIVDSNEWIDEIILSKIDTCINQAGPLLLVDRHLVKLYLPRYVVRRFGINLACKDEVVAYNDSRGLIEYRGYKVIVGYENKVVLAHEVSAESNRSEYISIVNL